MPTTFISILLIIFIPILIKNKKTFPFVFILLNTNLLELSYGSTSWVLFSFGGGATGNVFLSYYVSMIFIYLSIEYIRHNSNYIIAYKSLISVIVLLLLIGILSSMHYGFQVQVFARVFRNFIRYPEYLYLAIYLYRSRANTLRFVRTVYYFLLIAFGIQLLEIIQQERLIINLLAPAKNEWGSYFYENIYINIPGFGELLYSWSRMHGFLPLVVLLAFYFYLSKTKISSVNNLLFVLFGLFSLFLTFSRVTMLLTLLTIFLIVFLKITTEKGLSGKGVVVLVIGIFVFLFFSYQYKDLLASVTGRLSTVEDLRYGGDTALVRLAALDYQLKNFFESIIFGKGYSYSDSFFIINPDLGISNLLPLFGLLGLVLPLSIIFISLKLIKKIKIYDKSFYIVSLVVVIAFIVIFGLVQDVYLDKIYYIYPLFSVIEAKINNPNWPNEKIDEGRTS